MEWDSFVLAVAEWMMRFNLRIAGEWSGELCEGKVRSMIR